MRDRALYKMSHDMTKEIWHMYIPDFLLVRFPSSYVCVGWKYIGWRPGSRYLGCQMRDAALYRMSNYMTKEIWHMYISDFLSHYMTDVTLYDEWNLTYAYLRFLTKKKIWDIHIWVSDEGCWEVGGWGRVPFSRNLMSPTPRRKWYLTTGRRFH